MPESDDTMIHTHIYLSEELRRYATQLGDGVMAEGVRRALEQAKEQTDND